MTHEQFIKLETARLAKQAGFDWECSTFYTETFDYTNQDGTGKFEFRRNDNLRYRNPNDDRNSFVNHKGTLLEYKFEMYSAPTQSVLQRWLRELHNLIIVVKPYYGKEVVYGYIIYQEAEGCIKRIEDGIVDRSYESTLEVAEQKCLTLLIDKQ
jgi:hypothetical protein